MAVLLASSLFTVTISWLSSTALYVVPTVPLPSNSADALISCSIVYPSASPAQNTRFPLLGTPFAGSWTWILIAFSCCVSLLCPMTPVSFIEVSGYKPPWSGSCTVLTSFGFASFMLALRCFFTTNAKMQRRITITTANPTAKPRTRPFLLCFFGDGGGKMTNPLLLDCSLCPSGGPCDDEAVFGDSKKGERELHARLMISPQRPGFNENAVISNRKSVGVTGIGPVRLLPDTLKATRNDWFSGGTVPLKRLNSSLSELSRDKPVISSGIEPVRLL